MPLSEEHSSRSWLDQGLWGGPYLERKAALSRAGHIPTIVMLDFSYGGLDDELLSALYGDHIDSCSCCSRAVDVYRRQRPSDPARLYEVPEFSACQHVSTTYPLTPEEAGARLKNYLSTGSGALLIVAGEANPAVYTPELGEVLRQRSVVARRTGEAVPQVICGPAMGLNNEVRTPAETVFPKLAEEGAIQLYITCHRQRLHFRVSGENSVYTEEYHAAGNPGDRRGYWYESRPIANLFRRRFQAILAAELARPAKREDFVYLPMETIRQLEHKVGERFDSMTAEDLAALSASRPT